MRARSYFSYVQCVDVQKCAFCTTQNVDTCCVCPVGTMRGATGCAHKQHYHGSLCGSDGVGQVSRLTKVVVCALSCMEYDASA